MRNSDIMLLYFCPFSSVVDQHFSVKFTKFLNCLGNSSLISIKQKFHPKPFVLGKLSWFLRVDALMQINQTPADSSSAPQNEINSNRSNFLHGTSLKRYSITRLPRRWVSLDESQTSARAKSKRITKDRSIHAWSVCVVVTLPTTWTHFVIRFACWNCCICCKNTEHGTQFVGTCHKESRAYSAKASPPLRGHLDWARTIHIISVDASPSL
jgi:hypothetical protein